MKPFNNKLKGWIAVICLSLFILGISIIPGIAPATAANITFSDLQLVHNQIMVYQITETGTLYIGTFNNTDTIPLVDGTDYTFVTKPDAVSVAFNSPSGIIQFFVDNMDNLWSVGLGAAVLIGFLLIVFAIARR